MGWLFSILLIPFIMGITMMNIPFLIMYSIFLTIFIINWWIVACSQGYQRFKNSPYF